MAELRIRDVDDGVIALLKDHARRHGRTLGDEVRHALADAAGRPRREAAERLRALRAAIEERHGLLPDSAEVIRDMRDARG